MSKGELTVVQNRKAFHDYSIEERCEAGLVLKGTEVKALREGKGNLKDAYATIKGNEAWLSGLHIAPYSAASTHEAVEPERARKLLLHRQELHKLGQAINEQGLTLVPLRVYFSHGVAKVELGLARGRKTHDRRHALAEREAKREIDRARRSRER